MEEKNKRKNLLESIQQDIEITASNYAHMHERLRLRDSASKFFITYYSFFAIVFGLLPVFFEQQIMCRSWFDFLTISMSIIILGGSLLVSCAKYSERTLLAVKALDSLKRLKKDVLKYNDEDLWKNECEKYDAYVEKYHQIVDYMELRTDWDYYRTCRKFSSKDGYKNRWDNLSWFNQTLAYIARPGEYFVYGIVALLPIIALKYCIENAFY